MLHAILRITNVWPAILLTSTPYMLIHLVKPTPETIASFFGSIFLCWIAIKFKSIAIGIYLHILLAASMDLFVLFNKRYLYYYHTRIPLLSHTLARRSPLFYLFSHASTCQSRWHVGRRRRSVF